MGTARDITTSAMLVPCQLPQGWEERGCQTAKISGQGQRQAGPSTQMHRGGGAGAGAGRRLCLQLEGGAYGWGSKSKPLSPGLRAGGYWWRCRLAPWHLPAAKRLERCHRSPRHGQTFSDARILTFARLTPTHPHPKPEAEEGRWKCDERILTPRIPRIAGIDEG